MKGKRIAALLFGVAIIVFAIDPGASAAGCSGR
jgi:hypothetical protein